MDRLIALASIPFQNEEGATVALIGSLAYLCCMLIFVALLIAAQWKIFVKAGKPGWATIVPIYNIVILLELVGRPLWFIILFFIPLLNVVAAILLAIDLALSFGKDMVYAILIILFSPIMLLVLGFGSAEYVGPGAAKNPIFPAN